jgi:hypothetical protein
VFVSNRSRIAQLAAEGQTTSAIARRLDLAAPTVAYAATKRGAVVARPRRLPLEQLCAADTPRGRGHLKRRLLAASLKEDRCEACGLTEWRDAPLSMALHHANGDRHDNRLENLTMLCPNCHAQTESWGGRNRGGRSGFRE